MTDLEETEAQGFTEDMAPIAAFLIQVEQGPNALLRGSGSRLGVEVRHHTALHVSHGQLSLVLLENGADSNTVDYLGTTALGVCVGSVGNVYEMGDRRDPQETLETASLLLQYDSKITSQEPKN